MIDPLPPLLLACDTWTPSPRWMPAHRMHRKTPQLTLAHAFWTGAEQSAHCLLQGRDWRSAKAFWYRSLSARDTPLV